MTVQACSGAEETLQALFFDKYGVSCGMLQIMEAVAQNKKEKIELFITTWRTI